MVKITDGVDIISVTKGAYEQLFKKNGWTKVVGGNVSDKSTEKKINPFTGRPANDNDDDDDYEDDDELDLEDKTMDQLREIAEENGIDLRGARSKAEAREIITEAMKEE